jgi:hypothetical protein
MIKKEKDERDNVLNPFGYYHLRQSVSKTCIVIATIFQCYIFYRHNLTRFQSATLSNVRSPYNPLCCM